MEAWDDAVTIPATQKTIRSASPLEGAGGRAGDRGAAIARSAGVDALVHVAWIVAVVSHRTARRRRAGDVPLLVAGRRHEREYGHGNEAHAIALSGMAQ